MHKCAIFIGVVVGALLSVFLYSVLGRYALIAKSSSSSNTAASSSVEGAYGCEFTSNVGFTECVIAELDRGAAEREWKQKKLESIESPAINIYDLGPDLADEQKKIREWRLHFEEARDSWCESDSAFLVGSGIPSRIATCKLEFEIKAIETLNNIYAENVMQAVPGSAGIPDFEPSEADIDALKEVNKTHRGCVWGGETACDD